MDHSRHSSSPLSTTTYESIYSGSTYTTKQYGRNFRSRRTPGAHVAGSWSSHHCRRRWHYRREIRSRKCAAVASRGWAHSVGRVADSVCRILGAFRLLRPHNAIASVCYALSIPATSHLNFFLVVASKHRHITLLSLLLYLLVAWRCQASSHIVPALPTSEITTTR